MTRKIACEDDAGMDSEDQMDSASINKGSCGGFSADGVILKKGPWTAAEDAILVEHIKKFGEGNWNAVQKHSGLLRCGKSCRLRWTNHLRPNLKKGTFTVEEEHIIVELHAKMGNKWARMAQHLPGRTDNEIKNYWNTRVKRRQRARLPLYPPDVCSQAWIDGKHNLSISKFDSGDARHQEVLQEGKFDIPDVKFENYKADQGAFSYAPAFPDISMGGSFSLSSEVLQSPQSFSSMLPTLPYRKQIRESAALSPTLLGAGTCKFPQFDACENGSWEVHQPIGFSLPYNPDPGIRNLAPSEGATSGSQAFFNGNFSTSKPLPEAMKLELPSLQYPEASHDFWEPSPSLPRLIDNDDPSIQSSQATMQIPSDSLLPQSSGLLEEIIHESGALRNAKNKSSGKISNSSGSMATDVLVSSLLNPCSTDWDGYVDPNSPLGQSTTSIFDESTPVSACSLDELIPAMAMPQTVQFAHTPEFSTADAVLDPDSFEQSSKCTDDILVSHFSDSIYSDYCNQIAARSYYI